MKSTPTSTATRNARPIEPAPMMPAGTSGSLPCVSIRMIEPISGIVGTSHSSSCIALTLHLAQDIEVQSLELVEQLQHEAEADGDFGGGKADDHQEHDLAISAAPART